MSFEPKQAHVVSPEGVVFQVPGRHHWNEAETMALVQEHEASIGRAKPDFSEVGPEEEAIAEAFAATPAAPSILVKARSGLPPYLWAVLCFTAGFLVGIGIAGHAHAQSIQPTSAIVVSSCGTPPTTYTAGQFAPTTQDTTGKACSTASGGGGGGTSSNFGSAFPSAGTAVGFKDSAGTSMAAGNLDASGNIKVNVAAGGAGGGAVFGPTAVGSAAANPPVLGAGTANHTATGNVQVFDVNTSGQLAIQAPPTLPLPTGAATSAAQATAQGSLTNIESYDSRLLSSAGPVDHGASPAPTTGFVVLGKYNSTPPTFVNGDTGSIQLTSAGAVKTDASGTTQPVSGTVTANAGTGTFAVSAASLPLPTGASTETTLAKVPLAQASTTSGQSGPLAQGAVTTSAPTYTTAQTDPLSLTTAGALRTDSSATTQPVSGTVTANAGTNLNTSALATSANQTNASQKTQIVDGSGNVIASTSNNLNVQCANCSGSGVSTADAATFTAGASLFAGSGGFFQTTATSNALTAGQQGMFQVTANRALFTNLRNAAGAEVGTSTTPLQVSVANTGANGTAMLVTGTGGTFPVTGATSNAASGVATGSVSVPTIGYGYGFNGTTWDQLQVDASKFLKVTIAAASATNISTNVAQVNAVTTLTGAGATGTGSQRVTVAQDSTTVAGSASIPAGTNLIGKFGIDQTTPGTTNGTQDASTGSTGSAVPAKAAYVGANSSGNLTGIVQADATAAINVSTATTTQIVALASSKKIYVTHWDVVVAGADNITLEYGTGASCGTGTTVLTGAYNFAANGGISSGGGLGPVLIVPASNALCIVTSAAVQASGVVAYTQF